MPPRRHRRRRPARLVPWRFPRARSAVRIVLRSYRRFDREKGGWAEGGVASPSALLSHFQHRVILLALLQHHVPPRQQIARTQRPVGSEPLGVDGVTRALDAPPRVGLG